MQLRRDFHLASKSDVKAQLNKARELYEKADNKPGDLDDRPDRVSLSSGGESVKAILNGSSFIERYESSDGSVSIGSYKPAAWYNPFGTTTGLEVSSRNGKVEGETLEYLDNMYSSFHHHDPMGSLDARSTFAALEAQFQS